MSRRRKRKGRRRAQARSEAILRSSTARQDGQASDLERILEANLGGDPRIEQAKAVIGQLPVIDPGNLYSQVAVWRLEDAAHHALTEKFRELDTDHFIRIHDAIKADRTEIAVLKTEVAELKQLVAIFRAISVVFWGCVALAGLGMTLWKGKAGK